MCERKAYFQFNVPFSPLLPPFKCNICEIEVAIYNIKDNITHSCIKEEGITQTTVIDRYRSY